VLLLSLSASAAVAQVVSTIKCGEDACMASYPAPNDQTKAISGYYEPLGQAPIAVAHALQLPCGNKFLVMVGVLVCSLAVQQYWLGVKRMGC
jgi:hypothetical protein